MYAQLIAGQWQQLDGHDVEFDEEVDVLGESGEVVSSEVQQFVASAVTIGLWSDAERGAIGIETFVDDTTEPSKGKVRGSSSIINVSGVPTLV